MPKIFAIGDIHGRYDELMLLWEQIQTRYEPGDRVVTLGDYIDRGPNSAGVVQFLINQQESGYPLDCLIGNHEGMALDSATVPEIRDWWVQNYGHVTETSYGGPVPEEHLRWFGGLYEAFYIDNLLFSHSGGEPSNKAIDKHTRKEWLWGRDQFIHAHDWPYHLVFGHTYYWQPLLVGRDKIQHNDRITNLDTKAGYPDGALSCGVFVKVGSKYELGEVISVVIKDKSILTY